MVQCHQPPGRIAPELLARFIIPAFTGVQLVSEAFTERSDLIERVHEMWQVLLTAISPVELIDDQLAVAAAVFTVRPRRRKRA